MTIPTAAGPRIIGGRYDVERQLGSGATATVYLCRDRQTMGPFAVKVLHPDLAESVGADRFLREIQLTQGLDHPSIVPVIDSGADRTVLYCVLPYMEGGTLRDLLRDKKQLPIGEAIDIGRTLALAVAYAHDRGLIHRDIKPENILFSQGKAFLGDFGIARVLHATAGDVPQTTTGVIRGTPAYMSPEQASGERNYDGRSDIYSLGCVLYEMISGMPPFVGPTSQSVLAQRFSTTPRPMRTYRSSVSPALERVIEKAMMYTPADRFDTALEFAKALEVSEALTEHRGMPRRAVFALFAVAALVVASALVARSDFAFGPPVPLADTTQLAILPFERDSGSASLGAVDAFIYDAFSSWRGLTVVEPFRVRDAVSRARSASTVERDREVVASLGVGRFVRGEVNALAASRGWRLHGSLHQPTPRGDTILFDHTVTIAADELPSIDRHYRQLATVLLLRGSAPSEVASVETTSDIAAMQHFAQGVAAVNEWDFAAADSQFELAIERDPEYRRAYLWQAQVRFWQPLTALDRWIPLVQKALVDTSKLPTRERQLARALGALGAQQFETACAEFEAMRLRNDADFTAWFGLGRCRDLDFRIERDARSPTGWRYVASYADAVESYRKAFEVLSLSHLSLERGAFEPLRELLFMKPSKLQAATRPPTDTGPRYAGRLDWDNGRPILRPVPIALVMQSDPAAVPAGMRRAIESQRKLFRDIARAWSTALPGSAGAKEAIAVALEMEGDPGAVDSLSVARRLATDPDARLRLAAAQTILRLKLADPADAAAVEGIRATADSLIRSRPNPSRTEAAHLVALAVLLGRCELGAALAARAPSSVLRNVPVDVSGAVEGLIVREMLGCSTSAPREIDLLKGRIARAGVSDADGNSLLARAVQATDRRYPNLIATWPVSTYLITAQRGAIDGRHEVVRSTMARRDSARLGTGYDDIGPDAIYLESQVLLAIGDTAAAATSLDRLFERLPFLTPGMLSKPIEMSGLLQAMRLRGEIARARGETGRSAAWGSVRRTLWTLPAQ